MEFSVGASLSHFDIHTIVTSIPAQRGHRPTTPTETPATGSGSPTCPRGRTGTRLILRKKRPVPRAELRITDAHGMRITGLLTNTTSGQLADLELRHRRHARVEDRIRCGKDMVRM